MSYTLVGKHVRVHLYSREGIALGTVSGRVVDFSPKVKVGPGMNKDLVYVVDIETGDPEVPYTNSTGEENESWFAVQDVEVIDEESPRLFSN